MIVAMERIKSNAGQKWLEPRRERLVHISSDNGFWGNNGCGYVSNKINAGVYRLEDAFRRTSHCGPEKRVRFHFVKVSALGGLAGELVGLLKHCKMFILDNKGYCGTRSEEIALLESEFKKLGI